MNTVSPQCNVFEKTKKRGTEILLHCRCVKDYFIVDFQTLTWLVSAIIVPAVQCSVWKGSCAGCLRQQRLMPRSIMKETVVLGGRGDGAVFAEVAVLCCRSLCFGLHCAGVRNDGLV